MKDALVEFTTLLLVLSSLLVRSSFQIILYVGGLWLAGFLWPYAADAVGIPQRKLYDFVLAAAQALFRLVS